MNNIALSLTFLLGCTVIYCKADCRLKMKNLKVVETKRLVCTQLSLVSDQTDMAFSQLKVTVTGAADKDRFNIKLTNQVCHENIHFTEHKNVIHLCGRIPSTIKSIQSMYMSKATVLTSIGTSSVDCILEVDKGQSHVSMITGSVRHAGHCQSSDHERVATWCASHLMGDSNEFCCSNRNSGVDQCPHIEVDDNLDLLQTKVFTIHSGRAMCVQVVPSFSADVKTFAMHHDNDRRSSLRIEVSYDNQTAIPYLLGNHYCLGDILPEMNGFDPGETNKIILCTGKVASDEDITLAAFFRLTGTLRYSITTASGNRLNKIKPLNMDLPALMLDAETNDYCQVNGVRKHCPKCEQSCSVMLDGMGFLKCHDEWYWYPSNISREPVMRRINQKASGDTVYHSHASHADDSHDPLFSHGRGQENKGAITSGWMHLISLFLLILL